MTKEDLQNYQAIKREHDQLLQQMEEVESSLYYARTQRLDGMPRASSEAGRPTEALAISQAELWKHYKARADQLARRQLAVERAIDALEPLERTLLRCRYIEGIKWEDVSERLNYSLRHVRRLHQKALRKLAEA